MTTCTSCKKPFLNNKKSFWVLTDYYGITGDFCGTCYRSVSHDSSGIPRHPIKYKRIKKILDIENSFKLL